MFSNLHLSRILKKRIPILTWLPKYNSELAISDLLAGITVGLTLIPQVIAYAALAGLSPQYGLYSAFAGSFVYMIFGTTPEVNIGPTALISLLTYTYTHGTDQKMTVLLCFLCGCIQILCGVFHLGFLVEFVSIPVTTGFASATSIIIASSQVKGLLGLDFESEHFIDTWIQLFTQLQNIRIGDTCLGVICCFTLLCLRNLKDLKISSKNGKSFTAKEQQLQKCLWFISVGRNALVVVICAVISVIFEKTSTTPYKLTGKIDPGLPSFAIPQFTIEYGNKTHNFIENVMHYGSGLIVLPLIAILQNIAIAKAFSKGLVVNATQEMISLGLCNLAGSFFGSYPVSGSFSRSAVSNASGIRTPFGGLYTGTMVVLALAFLTPYFYYIPKATLSSVIICAVIFMVEFSAVKSIWKTNKLDIIPLFSTFLACLFVGVELGILFGITIDICIALFFMARPKIIVQNKKTPNDGIQYMFITLKGNLLFPAIDHLRTTITKTNNQLPVVLNGQYIHRGDYSAVQGISSLVKDLHQIHRIIVFYDFEEGILKILTTASNTPLLIANNEQVLNNILKESNVRRMTLKNDEVQDFVSLELSTDAKIAATNL